MINSGGLFPLFPKKLPARSSQANRANLSTVEINKLGGLWYKASSITLHGSLLFGIFPKSQFLFLHVKWKLSSPNI